MRPVATAHVFGETISSFSILGRFLMLENRNYLTQAMKSLASACLAALLITLITWDAMSQSTAAKLLSEGTYYQSGDDTSDRAADSYRQLILRYPKSTQAEQAQFYLGTYYENKFFILEHKYKTQDWSSFNQAEDALHTYVAKYPRGSYSADAYFALAMISLRRGYNHNKYRADAISSLNKMSAQKADSNVYIYRVVWTPYSEDVVKLTCYKNSLAAYEQILINRNSTFDAFTIALTLWCRNNCK
jgi:outer membrane protein assembly factor BamD (BamD/ComL family)